MTLRELAVTVGVTVPDITSGVQKSETTMENVYFALYLHGFQNVFI